MQLRKGSFQSSTSFPTRFTEDLARRIRQHRLRGHVISALWEGIRDALISAREDSDQVGVLVHPYPGPLRVRCIDFEISEAKDQGRTANSSSPMRGRGLRRHWRWHIGCIRIRHRQAS